jgi:tripartite-type tricarboxylate transporter receptor subunit TctC
MIAQSTEMKEQFMRNGAESITTSPAELSKLVTTEIDKYVKVIKAAGIKPQ